jgi:hypothetical protein
MTNRNNPPFDPLSITQKKTKVEKEELTQIDKTYILDNVDMMDLSHFDQTKLLSEVELFAYQGFQWHKIWAHMMKIDKSNFLTDVQTIHAWVSTRGTAFETVKVVNKTLEKGMELIVQKTKKYSIRPNLNSCKKDEITMGQVVAAFPFHYAMAISAVKSFVPPAQDMDLPVNMHFSSAPALFTYEVFQKYGTSFLNWSVAFSKLISPKNEKIDKDRIQNIMIAVYRSDQYNQDQRARICTVLNW